MERGPLVSISVETPHHEGRVTGLETAGLQRGLGRLVRAGSTPCLIRRAITSSSKAYGWEGC